VLNPPVWVALDRRGVGRGSKRRSSFTMKASAAKAETLTDTMDASAVSVANRASRTRAEAENVLEAERRMTALAVIDPSGWDEIHARAEKDPALVVLVVAFAVSDPDRQSPMIAFAVNDPVPHRQSERQLPLMEPVTVSLRAADAVNTPVRLTSRTASAETPLAPDALITAAAVNERCWPRSTMALSSGCQRHCGEGPRPRHGCGCRTPDDRIRDEEPEPLDDRRTALPVTELLLVPEIRAVAEKALDRMAEMIALAEKVPARATRRTADPREGPGHRPVDD